MMIIEPFPCCCGINVIGELDDDSWDHIKDRPIPATLKGRATNIKDTINYEEPHLAHMATINENQKKQGWDKALVAAGFAKIKSFKNPNTGHLVYVYWKGPSKRKSK
jgi:hypothetical protein